MTTSSKAARGRRGGKGGKRDIVTFDFSFPTQSGAIEERVVEDATKLHVQSIFVLCIFLETISLYFIFYA